MRSHPSQGWDGETEESLYKSTACPYSRLSLRAAHHAKPTQLVACSVLRCSSTCSWTHNPLPECLGLWQLESLCYPQLSYLPCLNWSAATSQVHTLLPPIY